ncbi:MAG: hypothetical protein GWO24_36215, partial [Akkermansiaceae bacterium]|nr:hypothetical protein [Akkermansiaceae bacterium]
MPTLLMNHHHTGSLMAQMGTGEMSVAPADPIGGILLGHLMFWWQSAQPVFNPLAGALNSATAAIDARFSGTAPRFQLETELFKFGESATVGLFSTILIVGGAVLAVWRFRSGTFRGRGILAWVAIGGVVGMSLNFATAIPYELARSSVAFFLPLVPLGLLGVRALSGKWKLVVPFLAVVSMIGCILHMALEPNRSLIPARAKAGLLAKAGARERIVDSFRRFRDRRHSGKELYEMVPEEE